MQAATELRMPARWGSPNALPRRLLYWSLVIVLAAAAALLAATVVPTLLGWKVLIVEGGSMGAAYPIGSLAVAREVPAGEVRVGDVLLMRPADDQAGLPVLHRVTAIEQRDGKTIVRTKGDANPSADPLPYTLSPTALMPAYALPYVGYLVAFVRSPLGWFLCTFLPAFAVCVYALRRIWSFGKGRGAPAEAARPLD